MDSSCRVAAAAAGDAVRVTNDPKRDSATMSKDESRAADGSEFLEGSQLSDPVAFRRPRDGKLCSLSPLLVDFKRLLKGSCSPPSVNLVRGISNSDLLHAVVGLYDVSLSEMTPDVLYATVCEKWARTIVLLRDAQDVLREFERERRQPSCDQRRHVSSDPRPTQGSVTDGDCYEPGADLQATFAVAYSDSDSESDEEEDAGSTSDKQKAGCGSGAGGVTGDTDDDEDYSRGIATFLKAAKERRERRLAAPAEKPLDRDVVGVEGRLVAALTYEKKYIKSGEKVIHVTILSVRRRFRGMGIGKYLLQQVKDPVVVGPYDAVVAHVDNSAVDFFGRYGFSDDVVLNSRWRELAEQFTNCTLMSYLPPYAGQALPDKVLDLDLFSMEQELKKWKEKNLEAYQAQVTCMGRMKAEIIRLRAIVSTQQHLLDELQRHVDSLRQEQLRQDKSLLLLKSLRTTVMQCRDKSAQWEADADEAVDSIDARDEADDKYDDDGGGAARLIEGLEQELSRYRLCGAPLPSDDSYGCDGGGLLESPYTLQPPPAAGASGHDNELRRYMVARRHDEVYDHGKDIAIFHQICEDFMTSMRMDPKMQKTFSITSISKALLVSSAAERYAAKRRHHGDAALTMRAYYCGSQEHPDRLLEIMKNGFSDADFTTGEYGHGLYFTRYASTATHFSAPGKLILAEILLGKCETVLRKDRKRTCPGQGYDSLLTPGRLLPTKDDGTIIQEYLLFDAALASPLFQIDYRLTDVDAPAGARQTEA